MERKQESKKEKQELVDRISSLPDHLLHSVMFLLCTKDAARMSLLSKSWDMVWKRFPIIDIDEGNYRSRQDFVEGLRLYLLRHDMAHLQELSLRTIMPMIEEIHSLVDSFLYAATSDGLQKLHLKFYTNRISGKLYIVPDIVFSDGSSLTSVRVAGCDFKSYKVLNLHQLRTLELRHVRIEGELIQRLMQSCPVLETFSLQYYRELKSIKIIHEGIRKFSFWISEQLEELEIHLPNLQAFKYKGYYSFEEGYMTADKFETLSIIGAYKLESFCLKYAILAAETFQSLQIKHVRRLLLHYIDVESEALWFTTQRFPFLEFLSLRGCKGLEEVKVLSVTIKGFSIEDCVDVKSCRIMAPNLLLFKYQGQVIKMALQNASEGLQVNLNFKQPIHHVHDLLQHLRLRNFFEEFKGSKMTIQMDDISCSQLVDYNKQLDIRYIAQHCSPEFCEVELIHVQMIMHEDVRGSEIFPLVLGNICSLKEGKAFKKKGLSTAVNLVQVKMKSSPCFMCF